MVVTWWIVAFCAVLQMNGAHRKNALWYVPSSSYYHHTDILNSFINSALELLTLTVLVATIDAQWEGMGDVGSARYEPALLPPCPTIRVLSYSN